MNSQCGTYGDDVADLVALDLDLGPSLLREIRRAHDHDRAVCVLDRRVSAERQRELLGTLAPTHIVDDDGERTLSGGRPVESGDGLVMLTSGTSGPPRAAVLTWRAVIASAEMTSAELYRGRPSRWLACLPACHIGGFAVLARAAFTDDSVIFGDPTDREEPVRGGATHIALVRTQYVRSNFDAYRVVLLGGGKPPSELSRNVVTTWGMTETGSGVVYNGRVLPGVDVAVTDGELLVRSPTLLRCYRDGTDPLVVGPDGRSGWLRTGDLGAMNGGVVTVFGRREYVINTGGEKVWPEDVEELCRKVDGVSDVAVIGVEDPEWGQRVVALVCSDVAPEALRVQFAGIVGASLGPWAQPKDVISVSAIPRTESGKIRRSELSSLARERAGAHSL